MSEPAASFQRSFGPERAEPALSPSAERAERSSSPSAGRAERVPERERWVGPRARKSEASIDNGANMHYVTGKHLPRRTFLRAAGASVALPFLDAMVPAFAAASKIDQDPPGVHRGSPRASGLQQVGSDSVSLRARDRRAQLRARSEEPFEITRGMARAVHHHQQYRRAHGGGVRAAGSRRRPLPLLRRLPDAYPSEADERFRPPGRHLHGPAPRAAGRPRDRDSLPAARDREHQQGRRMRLQLFVLLYRLHQLGFSDRASADDPQPADRVRHAVRSGRHTRRARSTSPDVRKHPRLGLGGSRRHDEGPLGVRPAASR